MKWFYDVYADRMDELNADKYTMKLYNDKDVHKMKTFANSICKIATGKR